MAFLLPADAATRFWVAGTGDWGDAVNWDGSILPGPDDDVVIDRPFAITVTYSTGAHAVKSILCQNSFVLSGGNLTVSNSFQVNNGLTITGGTLSQATILPATNGQPIIATGTFDGVTVNGDLDVGRSMNGGGLGVLNGLTINGTMYVGNPTNGWAGGLDFRGTQTLGGSGTVIFGNGGNTVSIWR